MRLTLISDLHGSFPPTAGGDLLIVAGDMTSNHSPKQWAVFYKWLEAQQYRKRIYIGGNHDSFLQYCIPTKDQWDLYKCFGDDLSLRPSDKYEYLCDSGTEFEGIKIWGSPWSLWFDRINPKCAAFTGTEKDLKQHFDNIPNDIDLLITHTPMSYVLDSNKEGHPCGSYALREAVDRVRPKLHIFGHIHERGGQQLMYKHEGANTWCVNASHMNEYYEPVNGSIDMDFEF
jgi:Calcineurin-like phosphoesterase